MKELIVWQAVTTLIVSVVIFATSKVFGDYTLLVALVALELTVDFFGGTAGEFARIIIMIAMIFAGCIFWTGSVVVIIIVIVLCLVLLVAHLDMSRVIRPLKISWVKMIYAAVTQFVLVFFIFSVFLA